MLATGKRCVRLGPDGGTSANEQRSRALVRIFTGRGSVYDTCKPD